MRRDPVLGEMMIGEKRILLIEKQGPAFTPVDPKDAEIAELRRQLAELAGLCQQLFNEIWYLQTKGEGYGQ